MLQEIKIKNTVVKAVRDDLTLMDVDAFVFYATKSLSLGSGYGNAISTRGGPSIKKQLDEIGEAVPYDAVVSDAGELNAKFIIHAVGPVFQEDDMLPKLKKTVENALKKADEKEVKTLAFPIMGIGFYGIAPELSIKTMMEIFKSYLSNSTKIEEVIICANDNRELKILTETISKLN